MRNFCTLSDKKYLYNGLSLYESLSVTSENDFNLYYLCLDDYSFHVLKELNIKNLIPINLTELENEDSELKKAKNNKSTIHGRPQYEQYCWALAPYFSWYCLNKLNIEHIFYLDSDLYFYQDLQIIINEIGKKSIGIVSHRLTPINKSSGEFNVGLVYFKNDENGKKCVEWWKNVLLDENNKWYKSHGTCGDQKYLELFIPLFGSENVCIIDETVGHGAPWNFDIYKYEDDSIIYNNKKQIMVFNHFSHFNPDFENNTYKTSWFGEWGVYFDKEPKIITYYDEYFKSTKKSNELIKKYEKKY